MSTSNYFSPYVQNTAMCDYCGVRPKFGNFSYCGRTCANQDTKWKPTYTYASPQPTNQWTTPNPAPEQSQGYYSATTSDSTAPTDPNLCEHCLKRVKSSEVNNDGEYVTHRYCGILCYEEASRKTSVPSSMIPAPAPAAASSRADSIALREEGGNAPIGRKILLMMQERWDSDTFSMTKLKSIYRVDLPGKVYRRFDFALQSNDGCTVVTTYYGGRAVCDIANDSDPAPCNLESCAVCDAIRSAFSQVVYGASSTEGKHGPGIYSYTNPALAHQAAVSNSPARKTLASDSAGRKRSDSNFVLIQCRVVTLGDSAQVKNPYAGFGDEAGTVFCSQSMAIIPTHLLVYRVRATTREPSPTTAAAGGSSRQVPIGIGRPPRRAVKAQPAPPIGRSLPNAPAAPSFLGPALAPRVPTPPPLFQPRATAGEGLKPQQPVVWSAMAPHRRRPVRATCIDYSYATTPETDASAKNNLTTEHTRATTLAPYTSTSETITIEAPRKPLVIASPKPIRPVVLDPAYIPLPASPGPPAADPSPKKMPRTAANAGTTDAKQPLAGDDGVVKPPAPADGQDGLPSTSNADVSETPPKPYYSWLSGPVNTGSISSPYLFLDEPPSRDVPRREDPAPDEDGVISTQDTPSAQPIQLTQPIQLQQPIQLTQPIQQDAPARPHIPTSLCRNCQVQPQFNGLYYCSKTCASEAHEKRNTLRRASLPKAPVLSSDPWDDDTTPARAPAFFPYSSGWEPTPPLTPNPASGTAVTPVPPVAEPSRLAETQPRLTPASERSQVYAPLAIDSEALGDFVMPPRLYQQRNDSYSSERASEPWAYTDPRAPFGLPQANEQPAVSGARAPATPVTLPSRLGDGRSNGSTGYLPSANGLAPPPMAGVSVPVVADDGLQLMTPTVRLSTQEPRSERGKGGDRLWLIKRWTNLSDLRKGRNKD